jgi:hypothetical protein
MLRPLPPCGSLLALVAISTGCIACGGSGDEQPAPAPAPTVSCEADPRLDSYAGELDKSGQLGVLSFRFFDLAPSPPAKGNNTFHVQVSDAAGDLMQGDLRVDLRMPDHGHGTSVEPAISLDPALGTYTVTPLYLFMPGVWRLEFEAFAGASMPGESMIDSVVLHFCVEG